MEIGSLDFELNYKLIDNGGTHSYHYQGIPDDILDLLFRDRYQYEIYNRPFDMKSELRDKINALEKNNRSLKSQVSWKIDE